MIYIIAIAGLVIFIYVNRHIHQRRNHFREQQHERNEQLLKKMLEVKRKADSNDPPLEEADTIKAD
jgi:hypothetical protein